MCICVGGTKVKLPAVTGHTPAAASSEAAMSNVLIRKVRSLSHGPEPLLPGRSREAPSLVPGAVGFRGSVTGSSAEVKRSIVLTRTLPDP